LLLTFLETLVVNQRNELENQILEGEQIMTKILIWLASGDMGKLQPGIMYGTNARKFKWVDDVQFVVFGESERLMLDHPKTFELLQDNNTAYCKFVADEMEITRQLEEKGANIIYVGDYISNFIKAGYQVITF